MAKSTTQIKAYHLRRGIDIKKMKELIGQPSITENNIELYYKTGDNRYLFIVHYGAIVFYNYEHDQIEALLTELLADYNLGINDLLFDGFDLVEDKNTYIHIEFSHLTIKKADTDAIKIILLNMAQSMALTFFDSVSQEMITEVRYFTNEMEQKGQLKINNQNILKFIGKALNTQNRIAENLYIFDAPDITWANEYYNVINSTLARHFELNSRYRSIENNLKIIAANLHAFLEVNNHRESSKLEWIIIILIFVEVIDTIAMKLL